MMVAVAEAEAVAAAAAAVAAGGGRPTDRAVQSLALLVEVQFAREYACVRAWARSCVLALGFVSGQMMIASTSLVPWIAGLPCTHALSLPLCPSFSPSLSLSALERTAPSVINPLHRTVLYSCTQKTRSEGGRVASGAIQQQEEGEGSLVHEVELDIEVDKAVLDAAELHN